MSDKAEAADSMSESFPHVTPRNDRKEGYADLRL